MCRDAGANRKMKANAAWLLLIWVGAGFAWSETASGEDNPLLRRYREGETLTYHMKGVNENWQYEIDAEGVVKKDPGGSYFEEYRWSNLISDGQKIALPAASTDLRQCLSLDLNRAPGPPNLSHVDPKLIGPITDFLTLYADLWLAAKTRKLTRAGDHFYFKGDSTGNWADGNYVLRGEDSIDFDMTLKEVNEAAKTAVLVVRHVPPENPNVKLTAEWMSKPVADTANNWVQVQKAGAAKFLAAVGKEMFDVEIKISTTDGKVLSGTIDNPLQTVERECEDAGLSKCGAPRAHNIRRHVEVGLGR